MVHHKGPLDRAKSSEFHLTPEKEQRTFVGIQPPPAPTSPLLRDCSNCLKDYLTRLEIMSAGLGEDDRDESTDDSFCEEGHGWCNYSIDEVEVQEEQDRNDWTDIKKTPFTVITFDQATHEAWEIAKEEINNIRATLLRKLRLKDMSDFKIEDLFEFITGPSSSLWRIIDLSLNDGKLYPSAAPLSHAVFQKVIKTFYVASSFSTSSTSLYNNQFIDTTLLSKEEDYKKFWKAVSARDNERYDPSQQYLWQRIMDDVNSFCRDFFLSNWPSHIKKHVTIDDDKDHYNGKMGWFNTSGLKPTQFVRDNRRGFVFHTLVFTASGIPLGLEAELVSDSSSLDTSTRLVSQQLAPSHRSRFQIPNLANNVFFADRAYWVRKFMYEFILPSGAEIGPSTHKKDHQFPFTFDQKLTRNDTRELVPTKGAKCLKIKHRHVGPHALTAVAYRDGYGKVVLGISSSSDLYHIKHWDFHLLNSNHRYKLLEDDSDWSCSLKTWIRNVEGGKGISETFNDLFHETTRVKALTTEGSEDQAWYLARAFSFTSSTSDKVILRVEEVVRASGSSNTDLVDNLNLILDYIGKALLPQSLNRAPTVGDAVVDDETEQDVDSLGEEAQDSIVDGINLSSVLRMVQENEGDYLLSFPNTLRTFSSNCVTAFLELLGGESVKSKAKNCEKILEWINCTPVEKRKYWFLKKDDLVTTCVLELKGSKTSYQGKTRSALIDLLAEPRVQAPIPDQNQHDQRLQSSDSSLQEAIVKQILGNTVLKPLSGSSRQSCRIGLDNEQTLLQRLLEESSNTKVLLPSDQNSMKLMHVSEIYRPGMVRQIGREYIKSSIDALGVLQGVGDGADPELVGIEVKTRTEEGTRKPEFAIRSNLQRAQKFVKIDYKIAKKYILSNHECIQILHHAFVYNLKLVLLLIGDKKGTILRGVWVKFDQLILTSYGEFLDFCYNESLKWAYRDMDQNDGDESNESAALDFVKPFLPKEVDFESFSDFFHLWKHSVDADEQLLPIPPTKAIIPFHFAKWNTFKGGSDAMTKLFWLAKHYVPTPSPSANAIAQLFRFLAVTLYRVDAVMTSNRDLTSYISLKAWRRSNRARQSCFEKFLRDLVDASSSIKNVARYESPPRSVQESNARSTRNRVQQVQVSWGREQTFQTPARKAAERYERLSAEDDRGNIVQRREACTGNIVFRVGLDENQKVITEGPGCRARCVVCHQQTRHFCTSCRHWICGPNKAYLDPTTKKETVSFITQSDGNQIYFRRSCWHMWHESGLVSHKDSRSVVSDISE